MNNPWVGRSNAAPFDRKVEFGGIGISWRGISVKVDVPVLCAYASCL